MIDFKFFNNCFGLSPIRASWRGAVIILSFFTLCSNAQTTFTQHLTHSNVGEGQVTIHQDADIEALVNGQTRNASRPAQRPSIYQVQPQDSAFFNTDSPVTTGRRAKTMGYRIQVYAGGNNRSAKQDAQRMAGLVRSYFSDIPVYTNFISPRWVCRVGDFKTFEEANEMLHRMQETHRFNEASIVKTQIVVYR